MSNGIASGVYTVFSSLAEIAFVSQAAWEREHDDLINLDK